MPTRKYGYRRSKRPYARRRSYKRYTRRKMGLDATATIVRPRRTRVEVKQVSINCINSVTSSSSGIIGTFCQIAAGTSNAQREGRAVKLLDASFFINASRTATTTATAVDYHRVIIGMWKPDDSSAASVASILTASNILAGYNQSYAGQYEILYDQLWNEQTPGYVSVDQTTILHCKVPINRIQTYYSTGGGDEASNQTFIIVISKSNVSNINCYAHTRFIDV